MRAPFEREKCRELDHNHYIRSLSYESTKLGYRITWSTRTRTDRGIGSA